MRDNIRLNNQEKRNLREIFHDVIKVIAVVLPFVIIVSVFLSVRYSPTLIKAIAKLKGREVTNFPRVVNRDTCSCSCWDGVQKGIYSYDRYQHIYINFTTKGFMALFWLFGILYTVLIFLQKIILASLYAPKKLGYVTNWTAVLVTVLGLYPFYYSVHVIFVYINDDMDTYMLSQMPFTILEIIVMFCLYHICFQSVTPIHNFAGHINSDIILPNTEEYSDGKEKSTLRTSGWQLDYTARIYFWIIFVIELSNIFKNLLDNLIAGYGIFYGQYYETLRTLSLLSGDLIHIPYCIYYLRKRPTSLTTWGRAIGIAIIIVIVQSLSGFQ